MARPLRIHVPGAAYHVIAKGNRGEFIFATPDDKLFYIHYLSKGVGRYGVDLHAYCLMDNHYHLLLSDPGDTLTAFMHFLGSSYGTHMRRRRGMIGHVFAGRYKSICVQKEKYLVDLSCYIHLNPVRALMTEVPEEYSWSSCRSYVGVDEPPSWLNREWILKQFGGTARVATKAYRKIISERIDHPGDYPEERLEGKAILGDEGFIEKALQAADRDRDLGEVTARRLYESPVDLKVLFEAVCAHCSKDHGGLAGGGFNKARNATEMFIWLAKERTAALNREIAALTGHKSPSSIPHILHRIRGRINGDRPLRAQWEKVAEAIWQKLRKLRKLRVSP